LPAGQKAAIPATGGSSGAVDPSGKPVVTSVKVHAPPGGKSNFSFY
jgi:hypothetical protein